MSYLTGPRLVFAGQFSANPSTVNNQVQHFNNEDFTPNDQVASPPGAGGWNPNGGGQFGFVSCVVQQVVYRDGTACLDPAVDPIVGATVNSSPAGKIADLDPQNQRVSTVFGFGISVTPSTPNTGFSGEFTPAPFADMWVNVPNGGFSSGYQAFYQSVLVLEKGQWLGVGGSRFLQELSASGIPSKLSIRFNVDNYDSSSTSDSFTLGRVVGSLGFYAESEPVHFVAGRVLQPVASSVNTAYAEIAGDVLSIDLGNSLQVQSAGGSTNPGLGTLTVWLQPYGGNPIPIGWIDPSMQSKWYERTAGIVSFKLTPYQLAMASQSPLVVMSGDRQPLLQEPFNGIWLRADDFVFRLNPGQSEFTKFYVTSFGQRLMGCPISLALTPSSSQSTPPTGTPESALTFPGSITTGADGTAILMLTGSDPGNPRQYMDGQIYSIVYAAGPVAANPNTVRNASMMLNALVWSAYEWKKETINWTDNVEPILLSYANLYPVMKPFINLSNYESVTNNAAAISSMLSLPITDPNYMPVTRDLSDAKSKMILSWLSETPPKK